MKRAWTPVMALTLGLAVGASAFAQDAAKDELSEAEKAAARRAEEEKISDAPLEEIQDAIKRMQSRIKGSIAKADFPALEKERRIRQVRGLAIYPHPQTLKAVEKVFVSRHDPSVRGAAAWTMGKMKFDRVKAAKRLCSRIKQEWKNDDVLIGIAAGLGELQQAPDRKLMYSYFNHPKDAVYVSMIDCLGAIGSKEDLPKLHSIFSQYAKKSVGGVAVRVDTGASGTKDQKNAEAKGRGMLKKAKVVRRQGALHATQQAVKKLTGQDFDYADELWDWMKEHEKELGVKLKKGG